MLQKIDIDGLVRGILADLTAGPQPVPAPAAPGVVVEKPAGEIMLDKRVVSLADIKGLAGGTTKLIVSPKSILTPSVKDEIRKRKIEIAVRLPDGAAGGKPKSLWLAAQRPATFAADLLRNLKTDCRSFATITELVDAADKQLSENSSLGVALTRQAASLLLKANRRAAIRAIPGYDVKQTVEDAAEIDANLLVLHPERGAANPADLIGCFSKR